MRPEWGMTGWSVWNATCSMRRRSRLLRRIASEHDVTHFVHNAGLIWPNLVEEAKPEDITGLAQLHLGSALTLLQGFLPSMKAGNSAG
jgi:NADP-dependent 3-hydroxy acid dehydrogenase YdfG